MDYHEQFVEFDKYCATCQYEKNSEAEELATNAWSTR